MPIIRKKLQSSEVYPDDIRYDPETDTIQSLINDEWVDNPAADPRTQTTLPPRITSDTACDAAESVKDAFKSKIDGILTAIDGAQSAFTIAGIILSLFTFGVFGVFIALALFFAHLMLDAGTSAIGAVMTSGTYHTFTCVLDCHMTSEGRLISPGGLDAVESDITIQIGGLGATILNTMLKLAGEGGVNNLASSGSSTGDCSDCSCGECDLIIAFRTAGGPEQGTLISSTTNGSGDCILVIDGVDTGAHYAVDFVCNSGAVYVRETKFDVVNITITGVASFVNYYYGAILAGSDYNSFSGSQTNIYELLAEADDPFRATITIRESAP